VVVLAFKASVTQAESYPSELQAELITKVLMAFFQAL
jgi:hypothetical protein